MSSQSKRDRQFEAAERTYRSKLLRLMRKEFNIRPTRDPKKTNIAKSLKRPTLRKQIYDITATLFTLGDRHAEEIIQELKPKGSAASREIAASTLTYNQILIEQYTEHTVSSMSYVATKTRPALTKTLKEGYAKGETIPQLAKRVQAEWLPNRASAMRFARTATNEVYNSAYYNRYQDSKEVNAIQFSAHIDSRTSDQCRMLNGTIWQMNDPAIQRPPLHFNCRSRIIPYFGKVPKPRTFRVSEDGTKFSVEDITKTQAKIDVFKTKYWNIPISEIPKYPGIPQDILRKYTKVTPKAQKVQLFNKYADKMATNPTYMDEVMHWQGMIDAGISSKTRNQIAGNYTASRLKLHDDIINTFYKKTDGPKTAAIFGGPSGSGKSQLLKHVAGDKDNYVYINNDEIKKLLPEYTGANASFMHEEARDITDKLIEKSLKGNVNIIYDTTLRNQKKGMAIYNELESAGYSTQILSTNLPLENTLSRAVVRAIDPGKEGRYVPIDLMIKNTENINAAQFDLIDSVRHITIFDSNVKFGDDLVQIYTK